MRNKIPLEEFVNGTPVVPRLLRGDAYTIGSGPHVSEDAKKRSVYQIVPRRGLSSFMPSGVALDDRLILLDYVVSFAIC